MKPTDRLYSLMKVKAVDEEAREITGIASTISSDRAGDVMEPAGAEFKLPIPLLWQHDRSQPIGQVLSAKVTAEGIEICAKLVAPLEEMPNQLKARLEEAWQSIKTGLVRGLSIGFKPLEYAFLDSGGVHFTRWEWFELSAVTIPANAEATITTIKSLDLSQRAASGTSLDKSNPPPGVSGKSKQPAVGGFFYAPTKGDTVNVQEQIKALEAKRTELAAERLGIQSKAADEGRTKDAEEQERFGEISAELKAIDKELLDLREMEVELIAKATKVDGTSEKAALASRAPAIVKTVKNEEPGVGFAKFAMAMYAGKGDVSSAKAFAEHAFGNDVRLQAVMKAAVSAGTTTSPTWAGALVDYRLLSSEFLEFLRPKTIVGQFGVGNVPSLRRVPFNVRIPGKTTAGRAQWVGEGYRKPVTASGYEAAELKWAKIAGISVVTEELERFSDPSIQLLVRDDLSEAVIERADEDFVDPTKAVGTGASASPASITNGVTPIVATNDPAVDIPALWAVADSSNLPVSSAVYITDTATVRGLASRKNPLGQREYPNVTMTGGDIDGVPVIVSNYVPAGLFILAFASEIYLADDGMVNIDVSREATIVMDDDATATPTAAQIVSMFQTNQLAIRAERYINWKKRRPQAVSYLSGVNWAATSTVPGSGD
jgi:HK97 family phage major capsid protein/HK97 family phage prohead protease